MEGYISGVPLRVHYDPELDAPSREATQIIDAWLVLGSEPKERQLPWYLSRNPVGELGRTY